MNIDRIKVILNRIDLVLNNKNEISKETIKEIDKIEELILIIDSIKTIISLDVFPEINNNINNNKDIRNQILSGLNQCFNYFKSNKNIINNIFDENYHSLIKKYLDNFFALFITHNKNCINKINENSPNLNKELYQMMIFNIIDLYQLIAKNNKIKENKYYLLDIIIYFINKSLNIENQKKLYVKMKI